MAEAGFVVKVVAFETLGNGEESFLLKLFRRMIRLKAFMPNFKRASTSFTECTLIFSMRVFAFREVSCSIVTPFLVLISWISSVMV